MISGRGGCGRTGDSLLGLERVLEPDSPRLLPSPTAAVLRRRAARSAKARVPRAASLTPNQECGRRRRVRARLGCAARTAGVGADKNRVQALSTARTHQPIAAKIFSPRRVRNTLRHRKFFDFLPVHHKKDQENGVADFCDIGVINLAAVRENTVYITSARAAVRDRDSTKNCRGNHTRYFTISFGNPTSADELAWRFLRGKVTVKADTNRLTAPDCRAYLAGGLSDAVTVSSRQCSALTSGVTHHG